MLGKIYYKLKLIQELISEYDFKKKDLGKRKFDNNSYFLENVTAYNFTIGKHSYVANNSIIYHCNIGNYCSIGPHVIIGFGDHPTNLLSTSPSIYLNDAIFPQQEIDNILESHFKSVEIGNDVWIGAGAYIKNGVKIGNGAIIGSGSVVTKSIGSYEIVAGVPTKLIRMRFQDDIIQLLNIINWWDWDIDKIIKFRDIIRHPTKDSLERIVAIVKE